MVNIKLKYNFLKHHINLVLQSFRSVSFVMVNLCGVSTKLYFILFTVLGMAIDIVGPGWIAKAYLAQVSNV